MIEQFTESFLSGSHCYGKPGPDSDIDLIVRVPLHVACQLMSMFAPKKPEPKKPEPKTDWGDIECQKETEYEGSMQFKVGDLNLIMCTTDRQFNAWREGTRTLRKRHIKEGRPLTRDEAIAVFKPLRDKAAQEDSDDRARLKAEYAQEARDQRKARALFLNEGSNG